MLDKALQDKIVDFVRQKPRTVQEIAALLQKNWRTADRYVETLQQETGLLATRVFREGTRGALKIVFWNALDRAKGSAYQERLLQRILQGRRKEDFSPLDIYTSCQPELRQAFVERDEAKTHPEVAYDSLVSKATNQLLIFSGNVSFLDLPNVLKTIESLAKKGVAIKVIAKIDLTDTENVKQLLNINHRAGHDAILLRHAEQPLRAMIADEAFASMKEVLNPAFYRAKELKEKKFIFYLIKDPLWLAWLQKVFWHLWGQSIDAADRIAVLDSINRRA